MNSMRLLCLAACLVAAVASPPLGPRHHNSLSNDMKPSQWLPIHELESIPPLNEISLNKLESLTTDEGAKLVNQIYHLSQIDRSLQPSFVPNPSEVPAYIAQPNGQKEGNTLNELVSKAKQDPNFGNEEVTIFITGLPQQSETISKAYRKLEQAYIQRYNGKRSQSENNKDKDSSSDDDNSNNESNQEPKGNFVVIDLGSTLNNFDKYALLDVDETGAMIAKVLVKLTNEADVPQEIIHVVAQGIGAQVAGAAGRHFTRLTGHQLRRITALDPSKIMAKKPKTLTGLARGDAEFVDGIHTSVYGLGSSERVGNVDFFPNGPNTGVPGADNVVEAAMRATRYYAESVQPGNERNFPAVAANSLQQYRNKNGNGKRTYMGIDVDFDLEGDYILEVNPRAPFGRNAPAQKQNTFHGVHQQWSDNSQD